MGDKKPLEVIVVEHRSSGGMIHYAYQLCTAMAKAGADVTLITAVDYELGNLPHNFKVMNKMKLWAQIDPLLSRVPRTKIGAIWRKVFWNVRRGFRAIRLTIEWIKLTSYLLKRRPDIIQFGELENAIEAFFLRYMHRRGLVLSQICHEFEKREKDNKPAQAGNKLNPGIYSAFSAIFVHGQANQNRFLSLYDIPRQIVHSIQHGNEQLFPVSENIEKDMDVLREKYKLTKNERVILFFGNLTPSKGIPDLIRGFKYVFDSNKNSRLIVAGMPSKYIDMNELFKLTLELDISDVVIFDSRYIPMDEIEPLMKLADIVVYPYRSITQSGALQVAFAFGRPVVTTNVGGFPEVVDDGQNGFLVPTEAPEELAKAILKIIKNPSLAEKMGKHAKHVSETRFAWEPIAEEIVSVYQTIRLKKA